MLTTILDGPLGPQAPPPRHVTAVVLGVAFLAATLVLGDTMRAGFGQAFTDANAGTDVVVRSADEIGAEELRVRDLIDAGLVDQVAAVDGVAAAVPVDRGRRPRSSAPTATASAATVRPPPPPTGSTTPSSTPTTSPRAAPRRPSRRGRHRPRRRRATATSPSATAPPCSRPSRSRSRSSGSPRSATPTASARRPTPRSRSTPPSELLADRPDAHLVRARRRRGRRQPGDACATRSPS